MTPSNDRWSESNPENNFRRSEDTVSSRLSDYDDGNLTEQPEETPMELRFTDPDDRTMIANNNREVIEENLESRRFSTDNPDVNIQDMPKRDDSFYMNSYGSGSDSARNMNLRSNPMAFDNDTEGLEQDESYGNARRENRDWENRL